MLVGIMLRTYMTHTITVVWIINAFGLFLLFAPYFRYYDTLIFKYIVLYVLFELITFLLNLKYLTGSLKSIGSNINLIVLPIVLNISVNTMTRDQLDDDSLNDILRFISIIGTVSFIYAWITDFRDIIRVFNGANAYGVNVAGFFYGKNIYGAFISLTIGSDLYLLKKEPSMKRLIIILLKILAVIFSFSRAALLLTAIMVFFYYWLGRRRYFNDYLILFIIIISVIAIVLYIRTNEALVDFFMNSVFRISIGDAGRSNLRKRALERVGNDIISTLFGVGFAGLDAMDIDIDNTYIYIWLTGGIAKIAFYTVALAKAFKSIVVMRSRNEELFRICFSVLLAYLIFAFFESVAVLELGLLNFLFTFFIFLIPISFEA